MIDRSDGGLTCSFCKRALPRMILEDILLAACTTHIDNALLFQLSNDFDDTLLSRVHIFDRDGAHQVHFFFHHFDSSSGHVVEELVLLLLACSLESLGDRLFVYTLKNFTDRLIVEHCNDLNDEHEFANRIGDFRYVVIPFFKNSAAPAPVHSIQQLGDGTHTAVCPVV